MGNGITIPLNSKVPSQELLVQLDKEIDFMIRTNPDLKTEVEIYRYSKLNQFYNQRDMNNNEIIDINLPNDKYSQQSTLVNLSQTNEEKTVIDIYDPLANTNNSSSNIANDEDKSIFLEIMRLKGYRPMTSSEFFERNLVNNIQGKLNTNI
jgi:hypothetical protein